MMLVARIALLGVMLFLLVEDAFGQATPKPYRIYAILFRGKTDVEKGFEDYFNSRRIPVEIIYRDLARDNSRMPGFLEEIRQTKPDLVYTWGTSVTLGVVGAYDAVDPAKHITDIPVVFTLVAAPIQAKMVRELKSSNRNLTGVYIVAPTEAQLRAIASYRPFKTLGFMYTPTEQNSVVVLEEVRELSKKLGFTVVAKPFKLDANKKITNEGAADMIRDMKRQNVDWLYLPPDSYLNTQTKSLVIPAAMQNSLPTFATTEGLMETGALMGLVARYHSIGQFTAYKAEQILVRKVPASKVPVETLTRFSLQIRMEVAEQLKLPPPLPMFNYAELIAPLGAPPAPAPAAPAAAPGK